MIGMLIVIGILGILGLVILIDRSEKAPNLGICRMFEISQVYGTEVFF